MSFILVLFVKYIVPFFPEIFAFFLLFNDYYEKNVMTDSVKKIVKEGLKNKWPNRESKNNHMKDIERAINVEMLRNRYYIPGLIGLISSSSYGIIGKNPKAVLIIIGVSSFVFAKDIWVIIHQLSLENYPKIKRGHLMKSIFFLIACVAAKIISL